MGGAASIERSAGMDFESAISRFQDPLKQSLNNNSSMNSELFIPLVAMRQLSQNLIKYEELDRNRTQFSKSHSLPNHMAFESNDHKAIKKHDSDDKLDDLDTALIGDGDFGMSLISPIESHQKSISFSSKKFNTTGTTASSSASANKSGIRNRPNLFLSVESDNNILSVGTSNNGANVSSKVNDSLSVQPLPSPGSFAHVSPRGTLYVGHLQVRETGIFTMNEGETSTDKSKEKKFSEPNNKTNSIITSSSSLSYVNQFQNSYNNIYSDEKSLNEDSSDFDTNITGRNRAKTTSFDGNSESFFSDTSTFGPSGAKGRNEFIEIGTLGSGASGVVSEAVHIPSLTIVALKILPIHSQEKRRHVSRELGVLFRNLAEMRLLNEKDDSNTNNNNTTFKSTIFTACPNVLSLYNAFIDSRSGLINLVVEYMDGGSLEDLVKQGGCQDEYLLADIARQTLNGLSFLHANKSVHRDIKPANILCSSNGLVKIADFGISKVLDKTTAFAKTFVGTVCYMSPERISGENHSYSCDIWSFGLTLLAVAKGKFPLVLKDYGPDNNKKKSNSGKFTNLEETDGFNGPVGGAQGYWAVMKAICDDEPPLAGPSFSPSFNSFINSCLKKDHTLRWTADHLLLSDFITEKLELHGAMLSARSENNNTAGSFSQNNSDNGHSQSHSHSDIHSLRRISESDQSPATAQLFSVVAAKTGTLSEDHYSVASKGKDSMEVRLQLDEQEVYSAMYAIRMKHLERILDKLASKLDLDSDDFDFDDTENPFDNIKSPISARSDESFDDLLEPLPTKGPPPQSILKNSTGNSHSILKNSNRNLTTFDDDLDLTNQSLLKNNLGSSTRSVHFQDPPELNLSIKNTKDSSEVDMTKDNSNLYFNKQPKSHKNKPNLSLNLEDSINSNHNQGNSEFSFLPKTSAYFLDSKPMESNVDKIIETKQLIKEERRMQIEEIKKFLPKFNDQGIEVWKKFSENLQLPLGTVIMAAKARLENLVDLN